MKKKSVVILRETPEIPYLWNEIIDRNLHDVYGYDIHEIARECFELGRKHGGHDCDGIGPCVPR